MDATPRVYRTEATLKQAEVDIARLKERYQHVVDHRPRACATTPTCSRRSSSASCSTSPRCWSSSAGRANESRGGHFREDFPTRDDVNFMRHTMAYRDRSASGPRCREAEIRLDYKPVVVTRYQPMERKY